MNVTAHKRLLFLSESTGFGPDKAPGGGEFFAVEFLSELAKRGWTITVVCPPEGPLFRHPELNALVSWQALDLSMKIKKPAFLKIVWKWIFLSHRFRDHMIYGNGFATMKWLVLARLLWRARVFCHLHESSYEYYDSLRARLEAPLIHRFFAISDCVRELFIKGTHVEPDKVVRVHNGVPVANSDSAENTDDCVRARREVNVPFSSKLVVMVARTNELKGHEVLLRAVRSVRSSLPDVAFLIVGLESRTPEEWALYNHLQSLIDSEGIRDAMRIVGFRNDARRLMRCADVVVVPSTQEGFGRTAIEAMTERTPVIASRTGGLKEIITDRVDGWLFPPGDHHALAERLVEVLQNKEMAQAIARKGHLTARSRFSTEQMTTVLESQLLS
jgi:glycosyltransferase involved in cell wall biosynthesis